MSEKQTAGQRILASAQQALAFAMGEHEACAVHIPEEIEVARIRSHMNMSQSQFATYFGVSLRTLQEWEQGRAIPSASARAFLTVIDREPEAVHRALTGTSAKSMSISPSSQ